MNSKLVGLMLLRRRENASDESSSSSDEEWEAVISGIKRRKIQSCSPVKDYDEVASFYDDEEFKSHFRMSRATFIFLLDMLHKDLTRRTPGCPTIPSHLQLQIALWKMATMDPYRIVCDKFNVGSATACRAVRRVTRALFERAPTFIQWPSGDRGHNVMQGFEKASGFPQTIGAIDCTHIRIHAPQKNAEDYMNRKGFHSIQLQLVCDDRMLITHCFCGHPGSVLDYQMFRMSEVSSYIKEESKFPADSHILGDSAYDLHEHLLTPFHDDGCLSQKQKNFNDRHATARVTVERCIGKLKGRLKSLLHCLPMSSIDVMAQYVVACCVIHNICTLRGDEITVVTIPEKSQVNEKNPFVDRLSRSRGIHKRNVIMNALN